jgi:fatty-acid desaturase
LLVCFFLELVFLFDFFLFDFFFFLVLIVVFAFFLFFFCIGGYFLMTVADNLSNYFFHNSKYGYVSYKTKDNSRNVPIISYISLGGGWHNNHHHDPKSYRFGKLDHEIDIGARIIELIKT